jgi:N-acyl homoserine lactone hydrolase
MQDGPMVTVRRVDFGYFVRPEVETGTGAPRVEALLGYVVEHDAGVLLFDTGMGSRSDVDAHYRPTRIPLHEALRTSGYRLDQITEVANCHLHFDHCGGNPRLAGRPFFAQAKELEVARQAEDYTLPELVDPTGMRWHELDGATEVLPGVTLIPTPGHTEGHQSLIVQGSNGVVVVAGQSHESAHGFAAEALALRARHDGVDDPLPTSSPWMDALLALDPAYVVFAHDHSVWKP